MNLIRTSLVSLIACEIAALPLPLDAQQSGIPVIGFLTTASEASRGGDLLTAFHAGLQEAGFSEGKNLRIEYRWANDNYDRLRGLAAELVGLRPAVIVTAGGPVSALVAEEATKDIPIVFTTVADPVKAGLVVSLNKPGGNATGTAGLTSELDAKRLEFLHTIKPTATLIGVLVNPNRPGIDGQLRELQEAADTMKLKLEIQKAGSDQEGAHSAGISYLMTAVMLELRTLVLSRLTGASVAANIMQFAPSIVTGFAQTWSSLAEQNLPPGAFGSVKRFYNTGDTPHEKHVAKMLSLAPSARFTDGYGSSELAMAQFEKVSTANDVACRRCVGRPRWFVDSVIIVNAAGNPLPDGPIGYIAIKSPTLTPGYYNQPLLTQLSRLPGGYWLTGDVGYKTDEGDFYQVDRSYDVITTPNGPLYSLATEELLLTIPGIHDAVVIGANRFPLNIHSTVAIIVPERGQVIDPSVVLDKFREVEQFGRDDLPPFTLCVAVVEDSGKIPVGCTGKVLKRALRDSFWGTYRAYTSGDRNTFLNVAWNALP